ncbi:type III secretion system export apparatus subunit SctT [Providencia sp. PROV258]|uniref:type III secretion system export apparatus subunit SctT n=1 Tax=Providencia sp. PROV258 TaxID=2949946 RepID=UPI002349B6C8|nr:type III secretion system export apparatus subunit SctT [Providencia sp. PROV258]
MTIWIEYLPTLGLSMLRCLGVFLLVPLLNSSNLGGTLVRNSLLLVIILPIAYMYPNWTQSNLNINGYLWLIISEVSIGLILGFCAAIPFWAMDAAGTIIDTMRGSSMASIINPLLGQQSSLFGVLFSQVFNVIFLISGGFNQLIAAIYNSYISIPPASTLNYHIDAFSFISSLWQLMYELGIRFAMPAIVVIVLVDMALGLINRSAQQLNVFFLAMPIKSAFSLLMLIICFSFAFQHLLAYSLDYLNISLNLWDFFNE